MTDKVHKVSNVRLSFSNEPMFRVEPIEDAELYTPIDPHEIKMPVIESETRMDDIVGNRRFMVLEHEAHTNRQIPFYQRGYADQITKDAQSVLKMTMAQTYGRLDGKSDVAKIYEEMRAARQRGDMRTYRRLQVDVNSQYGKFSTHFPVEYTADFVAWATSQFPGFKPPYSGPLITDLWTSAAYPLGVPDRRWTLHDEGHSLERYCWRDVLLTIEGKK